MCWSVDKDSYVRCPYCVRMFYRLLSAIAKFLVHLFGEGREDRAEMGEGRGTGRYWGVKEEEQEMGMHEK